MGDELSRLLAEPAPPAPVPRTPQPALPAEVGPSFDCANARRPLETLLCSTAELRRVDLALVQPFYLMRHLAPDRAAEFRGEAVQFSRRVASECRIPETGTLTPAQARTASRCVGQVYGSQRESWNATALGLAPSGQGAGHVQEEVRRSVEQQLRLQGQLRDAGLLAGDGRLDGVFGVDTRRAITSYQARERLTVNGIMSDETAERLGRGAAMASGGVGGSTAEMLTGLAERQRELPLKLGRLEIRYAEYLSELAAVDRTSAVRGRTEAKLDELRLALASAPPSLVRDLPAAIEAALRKVRAAGPLLSPNALVGLENETNPVIRQAEAAASAAKDVTERSRFLLEGSPGDVLVLYNDTPTAPSAARTLSGAVRFVGGKPKGCTAHRPIEDAFIARELRERLKPAGIEDDLAFPRCGADVVRTTDLVVVQRGSLVAEGLEAMAPVLKELASRRLGLLATLTEEQVAATRAAEDAKRREIEEGLGAGTLKGYGLVLTPNGSRTICRVIDADASAHDAAKARLASRVREELAGDPGWKDSSEDGSFIALRRGECAGVYAEASGLGRIRTALSRDGLAVRVVPIWMTPADVEALRKDPGSTDEPIARPLQPEPVASADVPVRPPDGPAPETTVLSTRFERKVALVIGNGAYRSQTSLPNPPNDSADVSAALRDLGFDVVEVRDADIAGLRAKARDFSRKLDGADLALFFYAGHALQIDGRNYLVPVDAELQSRSDLPFAALDVQQIVQAMEGDERVSLVILDACRDNPFTRSLRRSLGTRSGSVGQGLAPIALSPAPGRSGRPSGTLVAFATQPDNVALDGDGRNSPFTTALLKHLRTPGLEVEALMKRVRSDVALATKGKQVPRLDSGIIGGDVVLTAGR